MATIQERNHHFRALFCYRGKRHTLNLGEVSRREAEAKGDQIDYLLLRLKQRLLEVPPHVTIEEFLLHDGQVRQPEKAAEGKPVTFDVFKDKYLNTHRNGAMEEGSLKTVAMHLGHFQRSLGETFPLQALTLAELQQHVDRRKDKTYRGKRLSPVTLRKEMASFRAAWNWAAHMGMVRGPFPSHGLVYPKADEKPAFMTWQEIERRLPAAMSAAQRAELWECLYLAKPELDGLLAFVKDHAIHGWVYPMFGFAGHTGARRSEMLRVLVSDVDFESGTVLIREKKRSRKERTTRRVPLTPFLAGVLKEWLTVHPGGPYLFCHRDHVPRSKKRSRTTGYKGEKTRATTYTGRLATVRLRLVRTHVEALTKDEAHDHFKRTLAGSKWAVVPGWHCFRHSFISLCASQGVDQRLIDEWVGHQTEEQRKRYRHLLPSTQQQAIRSVFGG